VTSSPTSRRRVRPPTASRRILAAAADGVVAGRYGRGLGLPLRIEPSGARRNLAQWAAGHRPWIDDRLRIFGALLFRGFAVDGVEGFGEVIRALAGNSFPYVERSSPRRAVAEHVYTSTEYPSHLAIPLHNENAYAHTWPRRLVFLCEKPARLGGETPLADCQRVLRAIPPPIRTRFRRLGVRYVRNLGRGLGLSWQDVFQAASRDAAEERARAAGYTVRWNADASMRVERVAPAIVRHPESGVPLWFNHAAFFHPSSLPRDVRCELEARWGEDDLPQWTGYGDGSSIDDDTAAILRRAYASEERCFRWRVGDVLLIENMRIAHGRRPYEGTRRVLVGMSQPHSLPSNE